MKCIVLGVVQRHETIVRWYNSFQGGVNSHEELVQIGSLIEGVDDVGDYLALRFHAMKFRDVQGVEQDSFHAGFIHPVAAGHLNPTPRTVAATEAVTLGNRRAGPGADILQSFAEMLDINGGRNTLDTSAKQIFRAVTQNRKERRVGKLNRAVHAKDGDEFTRGIKQGCELWSP